MTTGYHRLVLKQQLSHSAKKRDRSIISQNAFPELVSLTNINSNAKQEIGDNWIERRRLKAAYAQCKAKEGDKTKVKTIMTDSRQINNLFTTRFYLIW